MDWIGKLDPTTQQYAVVGFWLVMATAVWEMGRSFRALVAPTPVAAAGSDEEDEEGEDDPKTNASMDAEEANEALAAMCGLSRLDYRRAENWAQVVTLARVRMKHASRTGGKDGDAGEVLRDLARWATVAEAEVTASTHWGAVGTMIKAMCRVHPPARKDATDLELELDTHPPARPEGA